MRETKAHRRWGQLVFVSTMAVGMALGGATLLGCRVDEKDVERWGTTQQGPTKLVAVVTHDKYEVELRQRAALELIQMRPRGGRRIGIPGLADALGSLGSEERRQIIDGLLPLLLDQLQKMPEPLPEGGGLIDSSIPYKDAAFALLTDKERLIADEGQRQTLTRALINWSVAAFDHRLAAPGQMFSIEQMMREIGPEAAEPLPELIQGEESQYDRIASLAGEIGDDATKAKVASKLVDLAKYVASAKWVEKTKPEVEKANLASKLEATPAQLNAQVTQFQDESLTRVFGALKKVGTRPAIDYCLAFAADKTQSENRRLAAVAALEGRLDRNHPSDVEKILALATADDTPDLIRDLAFLRVGEMPREHVVDKLYGLFETTRWRLRAISAQTILKMSNPEQIPEFMAKLPSGASAGFAVSEPLYYGQTLAAMQPKGDKTVRDALLPFIDSGSTAARLTALGYFYAAGTEADLPLLSKLADDRTPTPRVDDEDARWQCDVEKTADSRETVAVSTIGDFYRLCVEPQIKTRT